MGHQDYRANIKTDKINNSMIVNALEQFSKGRDYDIFEFPTSCYIPVMCFTVIESPQNSHVGRSSPDNEYEGVKQQ